MAKEAKLKESEVSPIETPKKIMVERLFSSSFMNASNLTTKVYSDSKYYFSVPLDEKTGVLKNVLSKEEAEMIEKEFNLESGYLARNGKGWKDGFTDYIVKGDSALLDTSNLMDYVYYKVLLANNKKVANGEAERKLKPNAEWLITSEEEEANRVVKEREVKMASYIKYQQMSTNDKREYLTSIGKNASSVSDIVVDKMISDEIEVSPKDFLRNIENKLYKDKIFINKCIQEGLLTKRGSAIYHNGDRIGMDLLSAIDFMRNPDNQDFYLMIKSKLTK